MTGAVLQRLATDFMKRAAEFEKKSSELEVRQHALTEGLTGEEIDKLPVGGEMGLITIRLMRMSARASECRDIAEIVRNFK